MDYCRTHPGMLAFPQTRHFHIHNMCEYHYFKNGALDEPTDPVRQGWRATYMSALVAQRPNRWQQPQARGNESRLQAYSTARDWDAPHRVPRR